VINIVAIALGEAVDEDRKPGTAMEDDAAKPPGRALAFACQPLLDSVAAEGGIDATVDRRSTVSQRTRCAMLQRFAKRANALVMKAQ